MLGVGVGPGLRRGGVPVREVLGGSPAEQVGLAPADVITGFDGKTVNSDTTLTDCWTSTIRQRRQRDMAGPHR